MARAAKTAGAAAGDGGQRPVVTAGPDSRAPVLFPLFRSLADLPGVGPGLVTALARLTGRETPRVLDLLFTVPASRRDLGPLTDAMAFEEGLEATLEVAIVAHRAPPPGGRAPYRIEARACDVALDLVFFRARRPWLEEAFPPGGGCSWCRPRRPRSSSRWRSTSAWTR